MTNCVCECIGDEIEHEEEENSEHEEPQEKTKGMYKQVSALVTYTIISIVVKKVRAPRSKQTKLVKFYLYMDCAF